MSRQAELIKNTLIIAFGKLSTQFVTFLLLPLYTAFLSTEEFGTVDLILTYVMLIAPILTLQLEMAAFRFLIDARGNESQKRTVVSNTLLLVGKGLIVFAAGTLILTRFVTIPYVELVFMAIIAAVLTGLCLQFARGFGDNTKFSVGGVVTGSFTIAANIILIVGLGMGAQGMLIGMVIGNLAGTFYLFIALRLYRYISLKAWDKEFGAQLLSYSVPLVPNGVAWWAINAADRTIITIVLGVASNGIYAVAYKFPLIFNGLFSFFGMSWTESASVHINSSDRDKFFSQTMNASVRLFGTLGIGIIAFVPLIFGFLVAPEFGEAYMYIPILIVGAFFNSIVGLYSAIYIAKKMTKQVMNTSLIAAVISIGFTLIFIHLIGIYAAAFAMAIAFLSMAIFRHYDMKKYVTITYDARVFALLALMFAFVIVLYYLNDPVVNTLNAAIAIVFALVYNRSVVLTLKNKLLSTRQGLSPGQEVAEDILESPK